MKSHPPTFNTTYSYSILCRICLCGQQSTSIICILMRALSGRTPVGLSSHFMALHSKQDGDQTSLNPCLLTGKAALWRQDRAMWSQEGWLQYPAETPKHIAPNKGRLGLRSRVWPGVTDSFRGPSGKVRFRPPKTRVCSHLTMSVLLVFLCRKKKLLIVWRREKYKQTIANMLSMLAEPFTENKAPNFSRALHPISKHSEASQVDILHMIDLENSACLWHVCMHACLSMNVHTH